MADTHAVMVHDDEFGDFVNRAGGVVREPNHGPPDDVLSPLPASVFCFVAVALATFLTVPSNVTYSIPVLGNSELPFLYCYDTQRSR